MTTLPPDILRLLQTVREQVRSTAAPRKLTVDTFVDQMTPGEAHDTYMSLRKASLTTKTDDLFLPDGEEITPEELERAYLKAYILNAIAALEIGRIATRTVRNRD